MGEGELFSLYNEAAQLFFLGGGGAQPTQKCCCEQSNFAYPNVTVAVGEMRKGGKVDS